jgi:hypothetical protein
MEHVVWRGNWETTKTETSEIAIGTKFGIMSIRVVESANGHKVDIYTGFDPISREPDEDGDIAMSMSYDGDTGLPDKETSEFWSHRYPVAIAKAAAKWGGLYKLEAQGDLTIEQAIDWLPAEVSEQVREFVHVDAKALSHWRMLLGVEQGVSSAPTASQAAAQKRVVRSEALITKAIHLEERYAADTSFGSF